MKALALVVLLPTLAFADPATERLAAVQASYAKLEHVKATFTQTHVNTTYGITKVRHGKLYLARPDKMRWDYTDEKQDHRFIYDGETLWGIFPSNKEVAKHRTAKQMVPAAFAFLRGGDLSAELTVSSPAPDTIELVPKEPNAQVKKLTFMIDPKTNRVVKSIVLNHEDHTNTFVLANIDEKTELDPKWFQFSPKRVPTYKVSEY